MCGEVSPSDKQERELSSFRRMIIWSAAAFPLVLAGLSVAASFMGSARAAQMFNSSPGVVVWLALVLLLLLGLLTHPAQAGVVADASGAGVDHSGGHLGLS